MHDIMVLLRKEMASLRQVAKIATKRKIRKRGYIQNEETLTVGEIADSITPNKPSEQEEGEKAIKRVRT